MTHTHVDHILDFLERERVALLEGDFKELVINSDKLSHYSYKDLDRSHCVQRWLIEKILEKSQINNELLRQSFLGVKAAQDYLSALENAMNRLKVYSYKGKTFSLTEDLGSSIEIFK